jgi:hypothetical protein
MINKYCLSCTDDYTKIPKADCPRDITECKKHYESNIELRKVLISMKESGELEKIARLSKKYIKNLAGLNKIAEELLEDKE